MAYQSIFQRFEIKYLLTREQKARIVAAMAPYMMPDSYGRSTIRNVYFDTSDYRLIRRSIEKPVYKEKLRLRSYRQAEGEQPVFVEVKKKYKGIVYKRRLALPLQQAEAWLCGGTPPGEDSQIRREIDHFLRFYGSLRPAVFLSYEREAWLGADDFRVTFDENILCRRAALSLAEPVGGMSLLAEGTVLMELKCSGGIPLWMTALLTQEKLYKTSFSKYGTAYQTLVYPEIKEDFSHV